MSIVAGEHRQILWWFDRGDDARGEPVPDLIPMRFETMTPVAVNNAGFGIEESVTDQAETGSLASFSKFSSIKVANSPTDSSVR